MPSKSIGMHARAVPKGGSFRAHVPTQNHISPRPRAPKTLTEPRGDALKKETCGTANVCMHLHAVTVAHPKHDLGVLTYLFCISAHRTFPRTSCLAYHKPKKPMVRRKVCKNMHPPMSVHCVLITRVLVFFFLKNMCHVGAV